MTEASTVQSAMERALAGELRDLEPALDLASALERSRKIARLLQRTMERSIRGSFERTRARILVSALTRQLDFNHHLEAESVFVEHLDYELAFARSTIRKLARDLDSDLSPIGAMELAVLRAREVARIITHAATLTIRLLRAGSGHLSRRTILIDIEAEAPKPAARTHSPATKASEWLINTEMQLLPVEHRSRYTEEFHAELHELATHKATRSMQFLYAMQQFGRVWKLRWALVAPDRPVFYRSRQLTRWILSSDWRTWGLLGPPLGFAIVDIHQQQGWGSAIFTIPSVVAFHLGIEWIRKRCGIEVKRRRTRQGE